jgi:hypothetical protein
LVVGCTDNGSGIRGWLWQAVVVSSAISAMLSAGWRRR